ncbi:MAG: hypothetical protein AABX51_02535 [Nanoarchaeota archaeon]
MEKRFIALLVGLLLIVSLSPVVLAEGGSDSLRDRLELAKDRYQLLKVRYEDAKTNYTVAKQLLDQNRLRIRNASPEQTLNVSKRFVLASADRIVSQLERLKGVSDEANRTSVSNELLGYINQINNEVKPAVQNATTIEEVKAQAEKLRQIWNNAQMLVAKRHGLIFVEKLENLIDRIEKAIEKVDERINKLEDRGYNTSSAQNVINETLGLLGQAKQKALEAKAEFSLVSGPPGTDEHFKKGHQLLREANKLLQDAHKKLKNFLENVTEHVREGRGEKNRERNKEGKEKNETEDDDDGNQSSNSGSDDEDDNSGNQTSNSTISDDDDEDDDGNQSSNSGSSDDDDDNLLNQSSNSTGGA